LVGKGLEIKICDFGTDSDIYGLDYYQAEDLLPGLPIRWMAWESAIQVSIQLFDFTSTYLLLFYKANFQPKILMGEKERKKISITTINYRESIQQRAMYGPLLSLYGRY
jgi:hypothetical protein